MIYSDADAYDRNELCAGISAQIASLRSSRLVASRGPTHRMRRRTGNPTTLVSEKNFTQPIFSESTPPDEATTVRLRDASEESSANWVAVNAGEHKVESQVINAVPAIAPVRFSAVTH